jgi:hypothetical protein
MFRGCKEDFRNQQSHVTPSQISCQLDFGPVSILLEVLSWWASSVNKMIDSFKRNVLMIFVFVLVASTAHAFTKPNDDVRRELMGKMGGAYYGYYYSDDYYYYKGKGGDKMMDKKSMKMGKGKGKGKGKGGIQDDFGPGRDTDEPTMSMTEEPRDTAEPSVYESPRPPPTTSPKCNKLDFVVDENAMEILSTVAGGEGVLMGLMLFHDGMHIGSTTAMIAEANDAAAVGMRIADGRSGDLSFPHGKLKPIATVGERNICDGLGFGEKLTGVPDGAGAYLVDDDTLRIVVQSESYGPLLYYT